MYFFVVGSIFLFNVMLETSVEMGWSMEAEQTSCHLSHAYCQYSIILNSTYSCPAQSLIVCC